jgi:hypothetical protein
LDGQRPVILLLLLELLHRELKHAQSMPAGVSLPPDFFLEKRCDSLIF